MAGELQVTLKGARGIAAGDDNGFSDPYLVIQAGRQKKKTKTIKKTLTPEWNESFVLEVAGVRDFLLELYDWDAIGKDDFLGEVKIPVSSATPDGEEKWFPLEPRADIKTDYLITGEVCVAFSIPPARGKVAKLPANVISDIKERIKTAMATKSDTLDLNSCGLAKIPNAVTSNLTNVTTLDLAFNNFEDWPDLTMFQKLQTLNLSGNRLKAVGHTVSALQSLLEIYLNGNQIAHLPPEIGGLMSVEKVDLANNKISELPPEIGKLTKMEELNLTGNPLKTLPMDIGECECMELMDLSCCELELLPEQFCYMTRLMELNLGNNKLTKLPSTIGRMSRLVVLNLSDNLLEDLPLSMGYCHGLNKLGAGINLSRNPIKSEKMLQKWNIGTDHLAAFLEQRMDAVGKPELIEYPRSEINGRRPTGKTPRGDQKGDAPSAAAPEKTDTRKISSAGLADKLAALKMWGQRIIQEEFKPAFTTMKYEVSQCSTVEEAIVYATFVRTLKSDLDECRATVKNLADPPQPSISSTDDKLTKLRATLDTAVCDILIVINGLQRELGTVEGQTETVKLVQLVKAIKANLDQYLNEG